MIYFLILVVSGIVVYLLTPSIRYLGLQLSVVDKKNHRKVHTKKVVSTFGGIAIYVGFLAGLAIFVLGDYGEVRRYGFQIIGLTLCASLALFLGMYDDLQGSNAQIKFFVQAVIAVLMIHQGLRIERIFLPGLLDFHLGAWGIPLTILWLVGIMNAINLIDGIDGLAAGIIAIASLFFCVYGFFISEDFLVAIALALFGACLAFLKYNFYPAKIFMGDSGSLFLGCMVGIMGAYSVKGQVNPNPVFLPALFLLFVPILDTGLAIIRRVIRRQHIFTSDANHIHHYCLKKGMSQVQTVFILYCVTLAMGLLSFFFLIES